jgi:hypothetical protein
MNQERGQKSPKPTLDQIVEAKEEVLLCKLRLLLPRPEACRYASEYKKTVDSQVKAGYGFRSLSHLQAEDENKLSIR